MSSPYARSRHGRGCGRRGSGRRSPGRAGPGRIERGVLRQRGVKPSNPAGGCRHELGHALCARQRPPGAPGAFLMDLSGERRDRCVHAPDDTGVAHELRAVLLGGTRHVGRWRWQRRAAGHKQDDQVSAEADELLAHHSPSATARTTAATITARRIVDSMKGFRSHQRSGSRPGVCRRRSRSANHAPGSHQAERTGTTRGRSSMRRRPPS